MSGLSENTFVTGNTINTQVPRGALSPELLRHGVVHTRQWALLGPVGFPLAYGANCLMSDALTGAQFLNIIEWWAGFEDGGYQECRGFGQTCA